MKLTIIKTTTGFQAMIGLHKSIIESLEWNKGDDITQTVDEKGRIILTNLNKLKELKNIGKEDS